MYIHIYIYIVNHTHTNNNVIGRWGEQRKTNRNEFIKKQEEALIKVKNVLTNITPSQARVLLQHFKWDADKALETYTLDPLKICEKIGIQLTSFDNFSDFSIKEKDENFVEINENVDDLSFGFGVTVKRDEGECPICFDESILTSLPCGHKYCTSNYFILFLFIIFYFIIYYFLFYYLLFFILLFIIFYFINIY